MLKHHLKAACAVFWHRRLYALINVLGLGIGLGVCLIVYLFVRHETSFDQHFANAGRIIQIGQRNSTNTFGAPEASSGMVAERFPALIEEIEDATRSTFPVSAPLASKTLQENQDGLAFVDSHFLRIFDFNLLYGDAAALDVPDGIVLTESLAEKYFGSSAAAYGATLEYDKERHPLRVTGVMADLPPATHFQFKALIAIALRDAAQQQPAGLDTWWNTSFRSYALLREPVELDLLVATLDAYAEKEFSGQDVTIKFNATALTRLHLSGRASGLIADRVLRIQLAIGIGVAILVLAVINFVNLATATAAQRVLEVGLRGALGASRMQLVRQFLAESLTVTLAAALLALAVAELLLPLVNTGNALDLGLGRLSTGERLLLPLVVILIGLAAGAYPALVLTTLKPVVALRRETSAGRRGLLLRNVLVVLQFSVAILLIVSTLVFLRQIDYLRKYDLGFDAEQVLVVNLPSDVPFDLGARWQELKTALQADPGVLDLVHSLSSPLPEGILSMSIRTQDAGAQSANAEQFMGIPAEPLYLQFYGARLLAGTFFEASSGALLPAGPAGSLMIYGDEVILNEAAVRRLGWTPEEALGKYLIPDNSDRSNLRVRGVVANLINNVRREPAATLYLAMREERYRFMGVVNIRIAPEDVAQTLGHIDDVWRSFFPDNPIQRRFLDDRIEAQLQAELSHLKLFGYATSIAIAIACFGLYGLAVFSAQQRTKEIGIRKVNGGSTWDILRLLVGDFSKLVLLANLIAWPLAYWLLQRWLQDFTYRINLSPGIFLLGGLVALGIAWVTVGGTAAKAASRKPVLALRYE